MSQFDLIFLDVYLEPPQLADGAADDRENASWDKSKKFLTDLMEMSPVGVPLVMLISSEATADQIPDFRSSTKILASALQFMPKSLFTDSRTRAEATLLALVARRAEVVALWQMLRFWKNGVEAASTELLDVVRELEPSDYAYLRIYRLTQEKVPLSHYLVDLFNGYLSDRVERRLESAGCNALVDTLARSQHNASRVAPTKAISDLYAAVTTSSVRLKAADFDPPAWAGDIFLRDDLWRSAENMEPAEGPIDEALPQIFAVVTPACDLIPGRASKLRAVTTICGTLHPLEDLAKPSTHFLTVGEGARFHVEWHSKWPMTIPVGSMNGDTALDGRFHWVGRLRDLYHADLQQTLTKDVGRVGLPVVPTMPDAVPLRILLRNGKRFEPVLSFSSEDRAGWIFFNKKDKEERSLHLREDVIWRLAQEGLPLLGDPAGAGEARRMKELFADRRFIEALQNPIPIKAGPTEPEGLSCRIMRVPPDFDPENFPECTKPVLILYGVEQTAAKEEVVARAS